MSRKKSNFSPIEGVESVEVVEGRRNPRRGARGAVGVQDKTLGTFFSRFLDRKRLFKTSRELVCDTCGKTIKENGKIATLNGDKTLEIDAICEPCYWDAQNEYRRSVKENLSLKNSLLLLGSGVLRLGSVIVIVLLILFIISVVFALYQYFS